jgi:hypothetical protein
MGIPDPFMTFVGSPAGFPDQVPYYPVDRALTSMLQRVPGKINAFLFREGRLHRSLTGDMTRNTTAPATSPRERLRFLKFSRVKYYNATRDS